MAAAAKDAKARAQLQRLALSAARHEREAAELRTQDDGRRLGSLTITRAGPIGGCCHTSSQGPGLLGNDLITGSASLRYRY